jgi:carbamoyl-phosphate synthase large subunit
MNLLFSCIGKRGYIADFFRPHLQRDDRIIGTSNTKWTPGFEHCDSNYILPDIVSPDYIPKVMEICDRENISAIFSFFDPDVIALSKNFDNFVSIGIIPFFPKYEISEICFDKYLTYQFLTKHQFKTAKTHLDYENALSDIRNGNLNYPVYVKPRRGFGGALTFKAHNELELNAFYHYAPDMIIQEEIRGNAFDFDIMNDLNGNVISVVPWMKYLSRMGETERAQTFHNQSVIEYGVKLGTILGHYGPLDADLFLNGNEISVLEINLRFGGGYPVSHLAGADFPRKLMALLRGEEVKADIGNFQDETIMMKDNLVIGGKSQDYFNNKYIDLQSQQ